MFCRTSSGNVPADIFNALTCSLCYQYLMLHDNPLFERYGVALVAVNSSGLKSGTTIYPDVSNATTMSRICRTMDDNMCKNWKSCCLNADKCCQRQITRNITSKIGYCPSTWDGYSCFDEAKAGERVFITCPSYIKHGLPYVISRRYPLVAERTYADFLGAASPEHYAADTEHSIPLSHIILTLSTPIFPLYIIAERQAGGEKTTNFSVLATAYKDCTSNGTWFEQVHDTHRQEWTNYTTCVEMQNQQALVNLGLTCNIISIVLLVISCLIFVIFRQLRKQQRIRLHICLFVSLISTAMVTSMWDFLVYYDRIQKSSNPDQSRMFQNSGGCKLLYTLMRYAQTSNYFWMFCEGFYLHRLIVHAFEVPKTLIGYYIYGWGCSWIPVLIYAIIRSSNADLDQKCWVEHAGGYEYIVYVPNLLVVVANVIFFVNILRILLTQLQSHPNEPSNYRRAFKATFVLVPLFGLQWVLVIYRPQPTSPSFYVYEVIKTVLSNSQGTMVSLIFCIFNKEVHMHLKNFVQKHSIGLFQGEPHFNSVSMATHYSHVPGENGKSTCVPETRDQSECIPLTKMTDDQRRNGGSGQNKFQGTADK